VTLRLIRAQTFEAGKGVDLNLKAEVAFMNDSVPIYFARKPIYVVLLAETSDGHTIFFMRSRLVYPYASIHCRTVEHGVDSVTAPKS
jgi:hypothetical protein